MTITEFENGSTHEEGGKDQKLSFEGWLLIAYDINEQKKSKISLLETATWPFQVKEYKIILGAQSANWLGND